MNRGWLLGLLIRRGDAGFNHGGQGKDDGAAGGHGSKE
jgi:hypothetical protein